MKLKPIKVYHYFWIVSMVILVFGLFYNNPDVVFDINVGDTYYVIAYMHLAIALFVIYFSTGVGYWFVLKILKKPLIHYLTVIHFIIMFGWFLIYGSVVFYSNIIINTPFPLYDKNLLPNNALLLLSIILCFVAQPIYLVNLSIGIFRKKSVIIALVGLTLGTTLYSCKKDQPSRKEIYNQKANEFIFQQLKEIDCNCILQIPKESLLEISEIENPNYDMRGFIEKELNPEHQSNIDSLATASRNFELDSALIEKNNVKIITLEEIIAIKKDTNNAIFSTCPKGIIYISKPIFDKDFQKAIFDYGFAFTCVSVLPLPVYVLQKGKWIRMKK